MVVIYFILGNDFYGRAMHDHLLATHELLLCPIVWYKRLYYANEQRKKHRKIDISQLT